MPNVRYLESPEPPLGIKKSGDISLLFNLGDEPFSPMLQFNGRTWSLSFDNLDVRNISKRAAAGFARGKTSVTVFR